MTALPALHTEIHLCTWCAYADMRMTPTTNPRKLTTSGGMTVVSIPSGFLEQAGLQTGDRVVLKTDGEGFRAVPVEWEVRDS